MQEDGDVKEQAAEEVTNSEQQQLLSALEDLLCESAMDDLVAHALGEIEPEEEGMTSIAEQSPAEGRVLFTSGSVAEGDEEAAEEEDTDEAEVVIEKDIVGSSLIEKVVRSFEVEVDKRPRGHWDRVADAANNDSLWRGGHGGNPLPNLKAGIEAVLMERRERQNIIKVVQLPPLRLFPSSGSFSSPSSASSWTPLATPRDEAVGPWPLMTPSASPKSLCTDRFLREQMRPPADWKTWDSCTSDTTASMSGGWSDPAPPVTPRHIPHPGAFGGGVAGEGGGGPAVVTPGGSFFGGAAGSGAEWLLKGRKDMNVPALRQAFGYRPRNLKPLTLHE